jgi:predicted AAA+ superfamily ATPase
MFPLVPEELGKHFQLGEVLRFGSLPLVVQSQTKQEVLQAYAELYLKEEIRAEAVVRNLAGFARFLPIAALFHGQALNVASLARDSGTARTTVAGYLDILEDTLLAYRLPAHEAKLRVRERKHPKLYWTDPGVMRAAKRQLGPPAAEEMGALIEGWVGTLLRTYGEVRNLWEDLCYWAPAEAAHTEVDFLLRRGQEFLAIEVKTGQRLSNEVFSGLRAISDLKRLVRRVLIYQGTRELKTSDGIDVLPVQSLLRCLEESTLWP